MNEQIQIKIIQIRFRYLLLLLDDLALHQNEPNQMEREIFHKYQHSNSDTNGDYLMEFESTKFDIDIPLIIVDWYKNRPDHYQ